MDLDTVYYSYMKYGTELVQNFGVIFIHDASRWDFDPD